MNLSPFEVCRRVSGPAFLLRNSREALLLAHGDRRQAFVRHLPDRRDASPPAVGRLTDMVALSALFLAAFAAATLIPAQSEAVLVGMVIAKTNPVWLLLVVATTGNVLGSLVNWAIGWFLRDRLPVRWFPVSSDQLARAQRWYLRRGWWTLFGSWLPVIGDPLVLAAGLMREPFWRVVTVVTLAKAGRYIVLAWATLQLA